MSRASLLAELLGGEPHALAGALEAWLASRRFAAFAAENLTKVRKKLRGARDDGSARDLLLELTAAYGFVQDKRLSVVYEPTPGGSARGPDFAVTFTTRQEVMVEVTRLRGAAAGGAQIGTGGHRDEGDPGRVGSQQTKNGLDAKRLAGVLALKLGQAATDRANVLLVGVEGQPPSAEELAALFEELRQDAETTDPEALLRRGFRHRGEYLRRLAAMSVVGMRRAPSLDEVPSREAALTLWLNPQARMPLPSDVRRALVAALGGA